MIPAPVVRVATPPPTTAELDTLAALDPERLRDLDFR